MVVRAAGEGIFGVVGRLQPGDGTFGVVGRLLPGEGMFGVVRRLLDDHLLYRRVRLTASGVSLAEDAGGEGSRLNCIRSSIISLV